MLAISLNDHHLPDEYVDSAISFDAEPSENQELPSAKDILTSILPFNWPRSNHEDVKEDYHVMNDLKECHLPDVDASVLCHYGDDSDMSESEETPSAKDLLRYIVPIRWIRCNDDPTKQLPKEWSVTSRIALNECHLSVEYADAIIACDSSGSEESSPAEHLIGSVITFTWLGSNGNVAKKNRPVTNDIFLNACHLPDDYDDLVLASYGATDPRERSEDLPAKNVKFKCEKTTSAEPSTLINRSIDSFANIISADPNAKESSRNLKHAWVFAGEASTAKTNDSDALKKMATIGVCVGKEEVEASLPSAKVLRGALRRRTATQSVSVSVVREETRVQLI